MGISCSREWHESDAISKDDLAPMVPVPVTLNVYDVSCLGAGRTVNCVLGALAGAGAFHCGVEVHNAEWSYGEVPGASADSFPPVTGVFTSRPQRCQGHTFTRSIVMGMTNASLFELRQLVKVLEWEWPAHRYDLISKNCCHFSNELCQRLRVGEIPEWVNRLATAGITVEHGVFEVSDLRCCEAMAGEAMQGARSCRRTKVDEEDSSAVETDIHYLL